MMDVYVLYIYMSAPTLLCGTAKMESRCVWGAVVSDSFYLWKPSETKANEFCSVLLAKVDLLGVLGTVIQLYVELLLRMD